MHRYLSYSIKICHNCEDLYYFVNVFIYFLQLLWKMRHLIKNNLLYILFVIVLIV